MASSDQTKLALKDATGAMLGGELIGISSYPAMVNGGELMARKVIIVKEVASGGGHVMDEGNMADGMAQAWSVLSMLGSSYHSVDVAPIGVRFPNNELHAKALVAAVVKCVAAHPATPVRGIRITSKDSAMATAVAQAIRDLRDMTQPCAGTARPNRRVPNSGQRSEGRESGERPRGICERDRTNDKNFFTAILQNFFFGVLKLLSVFDRNWQ